MHDMRKLSYHHWQVVWERVAELNVRVRGFVRDHLGREVVREAVEDQDRVHRPVLQSNNMQRLLNTCHRQCWSFTGCNLQHTCSIDATSGTGLPPWRTMCCTFWTSDRQRPRVTWPVTGLLLLWSCVLWPQCSLRICDSTRYTGSYNHMIHYNVSNMMPKPVTAQLRRSPTFGS